MRKLARLTLSLTLLSASALAQSDADRRMARELGEQGADALDKRDYKVALDRFSRAEKLFHAPTLELGLGRALAANGELLAALETLQRLVREPLAKDASPAFRDAVAQANKEILALEPKIPTIVIDVGGGSDPTVTMDGEAVPLAALGLPRPTDPGTHTLRAELVGYSPATATVTVGAGEKATVKLSLVKSTTPPPPSASAPTTSPTTATPPTDSTSSAQPTPTRWVPIVFLGVGAVGLVTAGITGVLFLGKKSELEDNCPNGHCPADEKSTHDAYRNLGLVSTIGVAVGIVGAGIGTTLLLTTPTDNQVAIRPYVSPSGAGLLGTF